MTIEVIKNISVLFREEAKRSVPLLDYLKLNDLRINELLEDESRNGDFIIEFELEQDTITLSYEMHELEETSQVEYIVYFICKWKWIWEWYSKRFLEYDIPFSVYPTIIDYAKARIRPLELMEEKILELEGFTKEDLLFYYGSGPFDDFEEADRNLNQILEYDEVNNKENMREHGLYFDQEMEKWIQIPTSLDIIEKVIRALYNVSLRED
ncbi:hypothetical protein [Exiguobacterium antarcticum]|uniref:hypothetical protein n=1 Tax=Exiguobacterium antarcticum TaxID=132920 RepID=UPI000285EBE0|nr:hypothetical protein [Exiguobacterium antarcticum]AFS70343.1 Hypothetical protein Eab7_1208 [Exiguobacterium antarcticum B7]